MKISRNPNNETVEDGGSYVSNFTQWRVKLDGERVDIWDVIDADDVAGTLTVLVRSDDGHIQHNANGKPKTMMLSGTVALLGTVPDCTGCTRKVKKQRLKQRWWML